VISAEVTTSYHIRHNLSILVYKRTHHRLFRWFLPYQIWRIFQYPGPSIVEVRGTLRNRFPRVRLESLSGKRLACCGRSFEPAATISAPSFSCLTSHQKLRGAISHLSVLLQLYVCLDLIAHWASARCSSAWGAPRLPLWRGCRANTCRSG